MEIADTDGSGTIDVKEWLTFILKLDKDMSNEKLTTIFESKDVNQTGELSLEQFGFAIFDALKGQEQSDGD